MDYGQIANKDLEYFRINKPTLDAIRVITTIIYPILTSQMVFMKSISTIEIRLYYK